MQIRKFTVFTWDRIVIYGALCVGSLVLFLKALQYNWEKPPVAQLGITALSSLTMWAISARLFQLRKSYKDSIYAYTKQGVAVIFQRPVDVAGFSAVEEQVENAIQFFSTKWCPDGISGTMASADVLRDWVNGGAYTFTAGTLVWHGMAENTYGMTIKALGLTFGKNAGSRWLETETIEEVTPLIRHEIAHIIINAYRPNMEAQAQHKLMAALGWE